MRIMGVDGNLPSLHALSNRVTLRRIAKGDKIPDHLAFSDLKEWPENVWFLESPIPRESKLVEHIQFFAAVVAQNELEFQNLRTLGAQIEVLCSITTDEFVTSFHIPSSTMTRFCRNGIEFGVTITNLMGIPQNV